jgi:protein TonB
METYNISVLAGHSNQFQGNEPDIRNRGAILAILLSIIVHVWGGWLFLQVAKEAPSQRRMQPIDVTIVTPTTIPLPPPKLTNPSHQKLSSRSKLPPAPAAQANPIPVLNHVSQPQEIKKITEKTAQPLQALPLVSSREKSVNGSQPLPTPYIPRNPGPMASTNVNSTEGLPVIGPSFDAAYLSNPAPQYPFAARRLKLQGTTIVRVLVTPEGSPRSVRLEKSSGTRILDEAALDAVQHWLFVPARRGNKPITAEVNVPVRFRLN